MAKSRIELLLNRTVDNLGIVGDVVKVRSGFARNYLLPHRIAEHPTPERIELLKEARAIAQAEVAKVRSERESLVTRLEGVTIKLVRSCNDQGVLYGAVSQRDIADQLVIDGYGVDTRAVRLASPLRRIGTYHCTIQFDRDLRSEITVDVNPDRAIEAFTQQQAAKEAAESGKDTAEREKTDEGAEDAATGEKPAAKGGKKKKKSGDETDDAPSEGKSRERKSKDAKSGGDDAGDAPARKGRPAGKGESSAASGR